LRACARGEQSRTSPGRCCRREGTHFGRSRRDRAPRGRAGSKRSASLVRAHVPRCGGSVLRAIRPRQLDARSRPVRSHRWSMLPPVWRSRRVISASDFAAGRRSLPL
jgi:hypothetical protein